MIPRVRDEEPSLLVSEDIVGTVEFGKDRQIAVSLVALLTCACHRGNQTGLA